MCDVTNRVVVVESGVYILLFPHWISQYYLPSYSQSINLQLETEAISWNPFKQRFNCVITGNSCMAAWQRGSAWAASLAAWQPCTKNCVPSLLTLTLFDYVWIT